MADETFILDDNPLEEEDGFWEGFTWKHLAAPSVLLLCILYMGVEMTFNPALFKGEKLVEWQELRREFIVSCRSGRPAQELTEIVRRRDRDFPLTVYWSGSWLCNRYDQDKSGMGKQGNYSHNLGP